jgi:hypothetical protein
MTASVTNQLWDKIDLGALRISYEQQRAERGAYMRGTVEVDQKWVRVTRSPIYFMVTALAGVSVTFAPLFLYLSGQGKFYPGYERITVPLCFAVIGCVNYFYFRLGSVVAKELRQNSK